MIRVVRRITYEGPEEWVRATLAKSLRDGDAEFLGTGKRINVVTEEGKDFVIGETENTHHIEVQT